MNQVIHILKKDLRHFWKESAIALALLSAFVWNERALWLPNATSTDFPSTMSTVLGGLLLFGWMLTMVRAIQDESLVGERQFWLTRPYERKKLLAAKMLFVVVTINLPLLAAQMALLALAGFAPWRSLPGLLGMQLAFGALLLFLVAAPAAVTSGLVQMPLAALCVGGLMVLIPNLPWTADPELSGTYPGNWMAPALIVAGGAVVLILQYSRRTTLWSRWILLGVIAALFVIRMALPNRWLFERQYPLIAAEGPQSLRVAFSSKSVPEVLRRNPNLALINVPMELIPAPMAQSAVQLEVWRITVVVPDGRQWNSAWTHMDGYPISHLAYPEFQAEFNAGREFLDLAESVPVTVRFSAAFTTIHQIDKGDFGVMTDARHEFDAPGVGICRLGPYYKEVLCRAPLAGPSLLKMAAPWRRTPCAAGGIARAPASEQTSWIYHPNSALPDVTISPVNIFTVPLYGLDREEAPLPCAEIPLRFSFPRIQSHGRVEVEVKNLRLKLFTDPI